MPGGGRGRERNKAAVTNLRNAFRRFVTAGSGEAGSAEREDAGRYVQGS